MASNQPITSLLCIVYMCQTLSIDINLDVNLDDNKSQASNRGTVNMKMHFIIIDTA